MNDQDWRQFSDESRQIWDSNAAYWDEFMGEGNNFYTYLIRPTVERLLEIEPGEVVLEAACGNGNFARHLAGLGARVVAFDGSQAFIDRARQRSTEYIDRISYYLVDAIDRDAVLELGGTPFDAAVCNMTLMDLPVIDPLLTAVHGMLKPAGRFVFSIMHPCFNSGEVVKTIEEEDIQGELVTRSGIKIFSYIEPQEKRGLGVIGQPVPQYYFHRPLNVLLGACFQAGFVADALEEPVFSEEVIGKRLTSWSSFKLIPPVLIVRLRPKND
jgi:2-polyprenyl-3-methyl-5-hydroxy-6-metoxy-1,4-benzoquinol methylase